MSAVVLVVFQDPHPHAIIMQFVRQLQWIATKATKKNVIISFLGNKRVQ